LTLGGAPTTNISVGDSAQCTSASSLILGIVLITPRGTMTAAPAPIVGAGEQQHTEGGWMITNKHPRVESARSPAPGCSHPSTESFDAVCAEASLRIGSRECRIVCVDKVVPQHVEGRHDARARLVYAEGEIVHFELDHHRYALVAEQAVEPDTVQSMAAPSDLRDLLTNREMQIVQLICLGYLTKQVADRLHLSEFTVRSYLKTIYCKLGVRSRAAMVFRYTQAFGLQGGAT